MKDIILTGVKPTGMPHIGNYFGAILPAIEFTKTQNAEFYFFVADLHALNQIQNKETLKGYSLQVACTWLACGLDPNKVIFYKQSDIQQVYELFSILTNVTPKGLMNRSHAYKAAVDQNRKDGQDDDYNVNMGLFNYPILMAADILLFNSTKVPVGLDQKQHIEIARDIANYFNNKFGKSLMVPTEVINKQVAEIVGLDGRKMSKSYNNTIPLFADEATLKKTISRIVTDSTGVNEPKGKDNNVYYIYKVFANREQLLAFEKDLQNGISWGEAKQKLFELVNTTLTPLRDKYNYYLNNPQIVEDILKQGAQKAQAVAQETITRLKHALGLL